MQEKEWWKDKYLDGADYCECHEMCGDCGGGCSCWPDDHVKAENIHALLQEHTERIIKEIEGMKSSPIEDSGHDYYDCYDVNCEYCSIRKLNAALDAVINHLKK